MTDLTHVPLPPLPDQVRAAVARYRAGQSCAEWLREYTITVYEAERRRLDYERLMAFMDSVYRTGNSLTFGPWLPSDITPRERP